MVTVKERRLPFFGRFQGFYYKVRSTMRHPDSDSFYDLLGVCRDATAGELRAAFLKLAQQHHPDLNSDDPAADIRFKRIRRVYEILRDPIKRAAYDDHPHHFRLNDADIVGKDAGPIVTHPAPASSVESFWSELGRRRSKNDYRPVWLADRRFSRESRLAFAGVMSTMVALAALCVLLVRSSGHSIADSDRTIVSEPPGNSAPPPATSPPPEAAVHHNAISPLEHVISSVRDLRANPEADRSGGEPTQPSSAADDSRGRHALRPPFNVMDELNLPFPGWPLIPPPLDVPLMDSTQGRAAPPVEPLPPMSHSEQSTGSTHLTSTTNTAEPGWGWGGRAPGNPTSGNPTSTNPTSTNASSGIPASGNPPSPGAPRWHRLDRESAPAEVRAMPAEMEAVWTRAAGSVGSARVSEGHWADQPPNVAATFAPPVLGPAAPMPHVPAERPVAVVPIPPLMPMVRSVIGSMAAPTYRNLLQPSTSLYTTGQHSMPEQRNAWAGAGGDEDVTRRSGLSTAAAISTGYRRGTAAARIMAAGALSADAIRNSSSLPPQPYQPYPSAAPVSGPLGPGLPAGPLRLPRQ